MPLSIYIQGKKNAHAITSGFGFLFFRFLMLGFFDCIFRQSLLQNLSARHLEAIVDKTLYATFDGHVLKPDSSIELEPNTRVKITIETDDVPKIQKKSFLKTARSLELEGPSDWSSRLDDYLYEEKKAND